LALENMLYNTSNLFAFFAMPENLLVFYAGVDE
jgi:hypothetical protein